MNLGQVLLNRRKDLHLSLEEVYKKTKIHPSVLSQLENNSIENKHRYALSYYKKFLQLEDIAFNQEELKQEESRISFKKIIHRISFLFIPIGFAIASHFYLSKIEEKPAIKETIYNPSIFENHKIFTLPVLRIKAGETSTYLTYKTNDLPITESNPVRSYFLLAGTDFSIEGDLILLVIGDSQHVKLYYNEEEVLLDNKITQSLVFPRERQKNFTIPLFFKTPQEE